MKKTFTLLLLTISITSCSFGMEQDISNNNNESVATIITSDEQETPINDAKKLEALQEANTIANFLEFLNENEKIIYLPEVTSDQFNKVLPLLESIHDNKLHQNKTRTQLIQRLNKQKSNQQSGIKKENKSSLIELFKTANYLDVPLLYDCCTELLAKKLVTTKELKKFIEKPKHFSTIDQLPIELNRALVNKMPINYWMISKKFNMDFIHQTLDNHTAPAKSVAFSPYGHLLASASDDKTVNIYTIENNDIKILTTLNDHTGLARSAAFSPDGNLFASGSNNTVKIYTIENNDLKPLTTLNNHTGLVSSVAFSPDGRLFASGSWDTNVKIYTIDKNDIKLLTTLNNHTASLNSIAFSPDGSLLASASDDKTVNIYTIDPQNNIKLLTTLDDHTDWINSVAFSPDGRLLASVSNDKTVKIYTIDKNDIKLLTTLDDHKDSVNSVAFSPDGSVLASASDDKTVKIYTIDKNDIKLLTALNDDTKGFFLVAFNPDSHLFATISYDNTISVYDLSSLSKDFLIKPLLLLTFCINNEPIDLNQHPHLQPIFASLPEVIKNKLIEKKFIILPLSNLILC